MPLEDTTSVTFALGDGLADGVMIPSLIVEKKVEVAKETLISIEPRDTVALPGTAVGGMRPLFPVEVAVAAEKNVVIPPSSLVTEAGTKVGGMTPPPPTMVRVDEPEMIVVVSPLMMVVSRAVEMIVSGLAVVGGC